MELPPLASFLAILLSSVLLLNTIFRRNRRRAYNLPPGPKPWPIIGNLHLIGRLPHRSIHELSMKYGPLMQLRFGSFPVVVGSSVDMAKFFLKTHDVLFIDRPKNASGKHTTYNYAGITWTPYGAYWRQARKICLTELFTARRLDSFEHIRREEMHALMRGLFGASGRVVRLKEHLSTLTMNVITRMVLGKAFNQDATVAAAATVGPVLRLEEFKWMFEELLQLNGVLNIGDSIPWLDWLDLQGYVRRMKRVAKMWDRFLEHILDEHNERRRCEGEAFVARDMLDVLLQLADDPNLDVRLERDGVKAFALELIAGGTESSAVAVEWAMSELLRKPEIFNKASEELDRVIGRDCWVTEKDMPHLPYIEAIVKETMRVHPVAPLLAPRLTREDATVNGFNIPKGTRVLVNVWAIGRDPRLWDMPDEFMPERFIGSRINVKGQNFELLPFGSGRRMCPGYSHGLKVITVSLANLLHGFAWKLPKGMRKEDLSMEEEFGLTTTQKIPLQAVVEPKLPAHLYIA